MAELTESMTIQKDIILANEVSIVPSGRFINFNSVHKNYNI